MPSVKTVISPSAWLSITGLVLLCLGILGFFVYNAGVRFGVWGPNHAAEVARPIEKALEEKGAKKVCWTGDGGYGPSNMEPWYDAVFETSLDRESAIHLITEVSTQHGYALTHASMANHGPINVDDKFIDNWFYDFSHLSAYKDLEPGNIELALTVDNEPRQLGFCRSEGENITIGDDSHSIVGVRVKLPRTK